MHQQEGIEKTPVQNHNDHVAQAMAFEFAQLEAQALAHPALEAHATPPTVVPHTSVATVSTPTTPVPVQSLHTPVPPQTAHQNSVASAPGAPATTHRIARAWLIILLVACGLFTGFLAATGITYGFRAQHLLATARLVQSDITVMQSQLAGSDAASLQPLVIRTAKIKDELSTAQKDLHSMRFLTLLPIARTQYQAADKALTAAWQVVASAHDVLLSAAQILTPLDTTGAGNFSDLTPETKKQIMANLYQLGPVVSGAKQELSLAQLTLENAPSVGVVRQIKEVSNQIARQIPVAQAALDSAATASRVLPTLAGYPDSKRYLFLFLNNAELRPGGGFIGSLGTVRLTAGDMTEFKTFDVYDIDHKYVSTELSPEPLRRLSNEWYLHDSNWSPDFPTSAATSLRFYTQESGDNDVNGVIGITPELLRDLIKVTGPINVPGYPYTFTPENFTETLENAVEKDFVQQGIPFEKRKQIIGDLSTILLDKLFSLPREQWPKLITTAQESVAEKHIMVWYRQPAAPSDVDKEAAQVLADSNVDGHVKQTDHDFLMIVDANIGGLKSDLVIKRAIDYTIHWTDDHKLMVKASMTYQHTGFHDGFFTVAYPSYVRFYVPEGSTLVAQNGCDSGSFKEEKELGKSVFGCFKTTQPQTSSTITAEYQLPPSIADQVAAGQYDLLIQKQLGTLPHDLTVRFQSGATVGSFTPGNGVKESNKQVLWVTDLSVDRIFHIGL